MCKSYRRLKATYGVQQSVTLNLGHAAAQVVEVVALKGDHVVAAVQVHAPVVMTVAGGRVVGATIDEGVGDGDAVVGAGSQNDVLATNASSGHMVDPDQIRVIDSNGITTPDILGVDVGNGNVPGLY